MKASSQPEMFSRIGLSYREAFRHEVAIIPKRYPDSILHLLQRKTPMSVIKSGTFRQINLYAVDLQRFPDALFVDPYINWHGQHHGRKGLIAAAGIFIFDETSAFVTTLQSDLCQQLYRNAALKTTCKTQVDTRYGMWYRLLTNAIIDHCAEKSIEILYIPTAATVVKRLSGNASPGIYGRIYDDPGSWLLCSKEVINDNEYWKINTRFNQNRFVPLNRNLEIVKKDIRGLCIFHDTEGSIDTDVSTEACTKWLHRMLEIESKNGLSLTYSVVGNKLPSVRNILKEHNIDSIAFHSYDHQLDSMNQLKRAREVDYKIRGYRPPRSEITSELTNFNLSFLNFEWLLSSVGSLKTIDPVLDDYIIKIPVHIDDYRLYTGELSIDQWIKRLNVLLDSDIALVCVGLHDCYAGLWLDHYPNLLKESIGKRAMWNCDEIAGAIYYNASL